MSSAVDNKLDSKSVLSRLKSYETEIKNTKHGLPVFGPTSLIHLEDVPNLFLVEDRAKYLEKLRIMPNINIERLLKIYFVMNHLVTLHNNKKPVPHDLEPWLFQLWCKSNDFFATDKNNSKSLDESKNKLIVPAATYHFKEETRGTFNDNWLMTASSIFLLRHLVLNLNVKAGYSTIDEIKLNDKQSTSNSEAIKYYCSDMSAFQYTSNNVVASSFNASFASSNNNNNVSTRVHSLSEQWMMYEFVFAKFFMDRVPVKELVEYMLSNSTMKFSYLTDDDYRNVVFTDLELESIRKVADVYHDMYNEHVAHYMKSISNSSSSSSSSSSVKEVPCSCDYLAFGHMHEFESYDEWRIANPSIPTDNMLNLLQVFELLKDHSRLISSFSDVELLNLKRLYIQVRFGTVRYKVSIHGLNNFHDFYVSRGMAFVSTINVTSIFYKWYISQLKREHINFSGLMGKFIFTPDSDAPKTRSNCIEVNSPVAMMYSVMRDTVLSHQLTVSRPTGHFTPLVTIDELRTNKRRLPPCIQEMMHRLEEKHGTNEELTYNQKWYLMALLREMGVGQADMTTYLMRYYKGAKNIFSTYINPLYHRNNLKKKPTPGCDGMAKAGCCPYYGAGVKPTLKNMGYSVGDIEDMLKPANLTSHNCLCVKGLMKAFGKTNVSPITSPAKYYALTVDAPTRLADEPITVKMYFKPTDKNPLFKHK